MRHPAHEAFGGFQGRLRRFGLLEGDAGGGEAVGRVPAPLLEQQLDAADLDDGVGVGGGGGVGGRGPADVGGGGGRRGGGGSGGLAGLKVGPGHGGCPPSAPSRLAAVLKKG